MRLGLTQAELAERVGVSPFTIMNWELGRTKPASWHRRNLIKSLNFPTGFQLKSGSGRRDFPTLLQHLRGKIGLTQRELAARLGVSKETVWEWEKGHHEPTAANRQAVEKLAHEVFGEPDPEAERIRRLRKKLGLTQREFAAWLKVHPHTVSKWERGEHAPSVEALERMKDFYKEGVQREGG